MRFARALLLVLFVLTPAWSYAQREKLPPEDLEIVRERYPEAKRTSTSLRYVVLRAGDGPQPASGDSVSVLYTGKLLDGTVFDSSTDPAKPFTFQLDRGEVIQGFDEGISAMRVGEKRILIIPFELGYGTRGQPPRIPRRATLIFELELIAVKPRTP
jgi:FKBP-type peptidyl-prolyl cis-trans isomerase